MVKRAKWPHLAGRNFLFRRCRGAHLTDPAVAAALAKAAAAARAPPLPPLRLCLHGTPRQWRDPSRRWLGEEKERSLALLRAAGVRVAEKEYFADEPLSLEMHFRCVDAFELSSLAAGDNDV